MTCARSGSACGPAGSSSTGARGVRAGGRARLQPEDLVADDYGPSQALGRRCLAGQGPAVIEVPSAALPGTRNLVIFGAQVGAPYSLARIDASEPVTVSAEDGHGLEALLGLVRHIGEPHPELAAWRRGEPFTVEDPGPPHPLPARA
jgi:hypothetical protein